MSLLTGSKKTMNVRAPATVAPRPEAHEVPANGEVLLPEEIQALEAIVDRRGFDNVLVELARLAHERGVHASREFEDDHGALVWHDISALLARTASEVTRR